MSYSGNSYKDVTGKEKERNITMEPTVSGNEIPVKDENAGTETKEPVTDKDIESDTREPVKNADIESKTQEPVTNNYTYETYEVDNSEVCRILNELLEETRKTGESMTRIAESLDAVNETLTSEPEEPDKKSVLPDEPKEIVSGNDVIVEILECMKETVTGIQKTETAIYETVSGNTVYLEGLSDISQEFTECYIETSEEHKNTLTYGITSVVCILIAVGIVGGLNIAKLVWGKMR